MKSFIFISFALWIGLAAAQAGSAKNLNSYAKNKPDSYIVDPIRYAKSTPASLFDIGMLRLNMKLGILDIELGDSYYRDVKEIIMADASYDNENGKLTINVVLDKEVFHTPSQSKIKRTKDQAKNMCRKIVIGIKETLGLGPGPKHT